VFPIVGVNTVEHIKAMPEALCIKLSREEIDEIHEASPYSPGFPMNFTQYIEPVKYDLSWTPADHQQYQMAAWIDAPPKPLVSKLSGPATFVMEKLTIFSRISQGPNRLCREGE